MHYNNITKSKPIPGFENYQITSDGDVLSTKSGRWLVPTPTRFGELTVGLMRNGEQHRRSVKVMVAEAFVEGKTEVFNTPIQLDGNRENLKANNILWRPRWFAWRYVHQFHNSIPSWYYIGPIYDVVNNMEYNNILEAAITNGSLCQDIYQSLINDTYVFPDGEKYVYM